MDKDVCECCDVTPLNYEQFELRFDHYIADEKTGKKIRLEEPLVVRAVLPIARIYSSAYAKNEIIQRLLYEMNDKLKEGET